jgi:hypothetical protein
MREPPQKSPFICHFLVNIPYLIVGIKADLLLWRFLCRRSFARGERSIKDALGILEPF